MTVAHFTSNKDENSYSQVDALVRLSQEIETSALPRQMRSPALHLRVELRWNDQCCLM